ncbi:hypothetical protein [Pseudodesulfovibrio sp.]|uniref:hypothetical protein n=1 Tax=unclassified Pseudodesulfovibrio TaxID=2661612 RepID=UPI003AFFF79D
MIAGIRLHVEVGSTIIQRCPRLEIVSARHCPLDIARIDVPDPSGDVADAFAYGDVVRIEYGYRGGESAVWTGTLQGTERVNRDQLRLLADSAALPLVSTYVTECYADESSAAIARHLIRRTGLPLGRIAIPAETISRFPVSTLPVWQAVAQLLHTLSRAFGHDMASSALWLGSAGVNIGDFDEPGDVPIIATGENLIRHLPADRNSGLHQLETALLPGLSHSRRFDLEDTRLGLTAAHRALKVRHEINEERVRTFLNYGRERG